MRTTRGKALVTARMENLEDMFPVDRGPGGRHILEVW